MLAKNTKKNAAEYNKKARARYSKNHYDYFPLRFPKGKKAIVKSKAEAQGKSLNAYINDKIDLPD